MKKCLLVLLLSLGILASANADNIEIFTAYNGKGNIAVAEEELRRKIASWKAQHPGVEIINQSVSCTINSEWNDLHMVITIAYKD